MDLTISDEDVLFREQVRSFLKENLTPELVRAGKRTTSVFSDFDASLAWQRKLYERGWAVPDWPEEYGGTGWSLNQRTIFAEECALADAPVIVYMGTLMLAPVLMKYGNDEQKALLEKIASTEDIWCQGYSEPNAGSDLASLQSHAVRDGDDYVVNGSKIWTSFAHKANKIFCLLRTSTEGKPQSGISFFLIDLDTPGISIGEIESIDGEVEQCQVFFEDCRVPAANLVGKENQGWEIAKYLLEFERGVFRYYPTLQKRLRIAGRLMMKSDCSGLPNSENLEVQNRLAELQIDTMALEFMEHRIKAKLNVGEFPGALSSLVKVSGTELGQRVDQLCLELSGLHIARKNNALLDPSYDGPLPDSPDELTVMNYFLNNRAATIYGGAAEVQRNIIAKLLLRL